jgi:hypothetical protein
MRKVQINIFSAILEHEVDNAIIFAELLLRSAKEYEGHNYNFCLVISWTIIESLLQRLWERYVESNRKKEIKGKNIVFINAERKKNFIKSNDYSASVVSEILSLTNSLSFELYREVSKIRKARNDWIHRLNPVSRVMALQSVKVAMEMLNSLEDIKLDFPLKSQI